MHGVSFDVATQYSRRSPSADCSHLKWKSVQHRSRTSHSSRICFSRSRLTHDSLLLPQSQRNLLPPSVSSNSMNSLVVEGVFLSKVKSNQSSSTPGLPCCVLQAGSNADTNEPRLLPTTAAATKIAHPSDARGQLDVSRPLHAQLSRPFYPSSLASCRTPPKHCGSPEE